MIIERVYSMKIRNTLLLAVAIITLGTTGCSWSTRLYFDPFKHAVGVTEQELIDALKSQWNTRQIKQFRETVVVPKAGSFEMYKGQTVSKRCIPPYTGRMIVVNVVEGTTDPSDKTWREQLDTPALQAAPENAGAVFQVASNFDCLEGNGGAKSRITDYLSPGMYVQGEAAAISAMPGAIYRKYFNRPVNLLSDFAQEWDFNYSSGYVGNIPTINEQFGSMTDAEIIKASKNVYVGVQADVCVTGGFGPTREELQNCPVNEYLAVQVPEGQEQRVTQVFTAALNPYYNDPTTPGFKNLAKIFLHAAYDKTIEYAAMHKTNKLFLTLVGGGVFQNKLAWIAQAIDHACRQDYLSGNIEPLQITLVVYNSAGYKDRADWNNAKQVLQKLVKDTGGTWKVFS